MGDKSPRAKERTKKQGDAARDAKAAAARAKLAPSAESPTKKGR